jgi:hypothetical protein
MLIGPLVEELRKLTTDLYVAFDTWIDALRKRIDDSNDDDGAFFLFIDGLDEAETSERKSLLKGLGSLVANCPRLRLFLSGRESLSHDLKKGFAEGTFQRISMLSDGLHEDIGRYVDFNVDMRKREGDLRTGDDELVELIKTTLTQHADGM